MKRQGKKSLAWNRARLQLKREFFNKQIISCEICGSTYGLSFAHRVKRRFITDDVEMFKVALICVKDHEAIERLPHDEMFYRINEIIENRDSKAAALAFQ